MALETKAINEAVDKWNSKVEHAKAIRKKEQELITKVLNKDDSIAPEVKEKARVDPSLMRLLMSADEYEKELGRLKGEVMKGDKDLTADDIASIRKEADHKPKAKKVTRAPRRTEMTLPTHTEMKKSKVQKTVPKEVLKDNYTSSGPKALSEPAHKVISWVVAKKDNEGAPFVVMDRDSNTMFFYKKDGTLDKTIPAAIHHGDPAGMDTLGFESNGNKFEVGRFENHAGFLESNKGSKKNYMRVGDLEIPTKYYGEWTEELEDSIIYSLPSFKKGTSDVEPLIINRKAGNTTPEHSKGISKEAANKIKRDLAGDAEGIVMFSKADELDARARGHYDTFLENGQDAAGWFDRQTGKVYIDLSKVEGTSYATPEQRLKMTIAHEITHKYNTISTDNMAELARSNKFVSETVDAIGDAWGLDTTTPQGLLRATEELIAEYASVVNTSGDLRYFKDRYGVDIPVSMRKGFMGTMARLVEQFKGWIKDLLGIQKDIPNKDLYDLVQGFSKDMADTPVVQRSQAMQDDYYYKSSDEDPLQGYEPPAFLRQKKQTIDLSEEVKAMSSSTTKARAKGNWDNVKEWAGKSKQVDGWVNKAKFFTQPTIDYFAKTADGTHSVKRMLNKVEHGLGDELERSFNVAQNSLNGVQDFGANLVRWTAELSDKFNMPKELVAEYWFRYNQANRNIKEGANKLIREKNANALAEAREAKKNLEYSLTMHPGLNARRLILADLEATNSRINKLELAIERFDEFNNKDRDAIYKTAEEFDKATVLDKFDGGMTDEESRVFLKKFEKGGPLGPLKQLFEEKSDDAYKMREQQLLRQAKSGDIDADRFNEMLKSKYFMPAQDALHDVIENINRNMLSGANDAPIARSYNAKVHERMGRNKPPIDPIMSYVSAVSKLAVRGSMHRFVKHLIEASGFDPKIKYKDQIKGMESTGIIVIPTYDRQRFKDTQGFIVKLPNADGEIRTYKVALTDEKLNKDLFIRDEKLNNTVIQYIVDKTAALTRTQAMTIMALPFTIARVTYKGMKEEVYNLISQNPSLTKGEARKLTAELVDEIGTVVDFFKKSPRLWSVVEAVEAKTKGDFKTYDSLTREHSGNDEWNKTLKTALTMREHGVSPYYGEVIKRDVNRKIIYTQARYSKGIRQFTGGLSTHLDLMARIAINERMQKLLKKSAGEIADMQIKATNLSLRGNTRISKFFNVVNPFYKATAAGNLIAAKTLFSRNGWKRAPISVIRGLIGLSLNKYLHMILGAIGIGAPDNSELDQFALDNYKKGTPFTVGGVTVYLPRPFGVEAITSALAAELYGQWESGIINKKPTEAIKHLIGTTYYEAMDNLTPFATIDAFNEYQKDRPLLQSLALAFVPSPFRGAFNAAFETDKYGRSIHMVSKERANKQSFINNWLAGITNWNAVQWDTFFDSIPFMNIVNNIAKSSKNKEGNFTLAGMLVGAVGAKSAFTALTSGENTQQNYYYLRGFYPEEAKIASISKKDDYQKALKKYIDDGGGNADLIRGMRGVQVGGGSLSKYKTRGARLEVVGPRLIKKMAGDI